MKIGRLIAGGTLAAVGLASGGVLLFPLCIAGGAIIGSGWGDDDDEPAHEKNPGSPDGEPDPVAPIPAAPGAVGVKHGKRLDARAHREERRAA